MVYNLDGDMDGFNPHVVGGAVIEQDSRLKNSDMLGVYESELRNYLLPFDFTTGCSDVLKTKKYFDGTNIPVAKYLLFLEFCKFSLERKQEPTSYVEQQCFDLHISDVKRSVDNRFEKLNLLESWVCQYEQKYGSEGVLEMQQELELLR